MITTPALGTTSAFKVVGVTITALAGPGKGAMRVNNDSKAPQHVHSCETLFSCFQTDIISGTSGSDSEYKKLQQRGC